MEERPHSKHCTLGKKSSSNSKMSGGNSSSNKNTSSKGSSPSSSNNKGGGDNKQQQREKVEHCYHDYSQIDDAEAHLLFPSSNLGTLRQHNPLASGAQQQGFAVKLHYMLGDIEANGESAIVSWQPHGRCFVVHDRKAFVERVLPSYFLQSTYASFQRQLNLYGFKRISSSQDKGGYYHELFLRSKPQLASYIQRIKRKGNGPRKPDSPESEPDFYGMPYLPSVTSTVTTTVNRVNTSCFQNQMMNTQASVGGFAPPQVSHVQPQPQQPQPQPRVTELLPDLKPRPVFHSKQKMEVLSLRNLLPDTLSAEGTRRPAPYIIPYGSPFPQPQPLHAAAAVSKGFSDMEQQELLQSVPSMGPLYSVYIGQMQQQQQQQQQPINLDGGASGVGSDHQQYQKSRSFTTPIRTSGGVPAPARAHRSQSMPPMPPHNIAPLNHSDHGGPCGVPEAANGGPAEPILLRNSSGGGSVSPTSWHNAFGEGEDFWTELA